MSTVVEHLKGLRERADQLVTEGLPGHGNRQNDRSFQFQALLLVGVHLEELEVLANAVTTAQPFPYDRTFHAIAAATKLENGGTAIGVSVEAFIEAFRAYPTRGVEAPSAVQNGAQNIPGIIPAALGVPGCSHCYDGGCGDPLGCGETDRRNAGVPVVHERRMVDEPDGKCRATCACGWRGRPSRSVDQAKAQYSGHMAKLSADGVLAVDDQPNGPQSPLEQKEGPA